MGVFFSASSVSQETLPRSQARLPNWVGCKPAWILLTPVIIVLLPVLIVPLVVVFILACFKMGGTEEADFGNVLVDAPIPSAYEPASLSIADSKPQPASCRDAYLWN
jgi:ABC-type sugar transport system permease subunit